jgi:NAD(P)H dehydrogenase (quinone)
MMLQDYAEAAAAVLSGNGDENTIYELSGKRLNQEELESAVGNVLGKEVPVQKVDDATYADIMKGIGVPGFLLPLLVDIQTSIREGTLAIESNDFEKVLSRPTTPIAQALVTIVGGISR